MMINDTAYMSEAIKLAKKGWYSTHPNPRVGCIIVKNDQIIGQGWHQQAGQAHAEVNALKNASELGHDVTSATAYVTLEPCSHQGKTPPCCDALIKAGIKRVVVAMQDPNPLVSGQGIARLKASGIEVLVGVQEQEAKKLNSGFIKRMTENKPLIRCKMAQSLDGQTALASGESQWITGSQARADVQRLRAESSAILTGIGTVLADDPSMTVRDPQYEITKQPARIILDTSLKISNIAKVLNNDADVHIFCSESQFQSEKYTQLVQKNINVHCVRLKNNKVDLQYVVQKLSQLQFNDVLLESGKSLAGAMITEKLVDELVLYLAPKLMGSTGRGVFDLLGINNMKELINLSVEDMRMVGKDIRLITYFEN